MPVVFTPTKTRPSKCGSRAASARWQASCGRSMPKTCGTTACPSLAIFGPEWRAPVGSRSAPCPDRRPLLLERLDAFLGIVAHEDACREAHLVLQGLPEGQEGALLRRLLAGANGKRTVQADRVGEPAGLDHHLLARHDAVDQAHLVGALRGDAVGEQHHLHGVAP